MDVDLALPSVASSSEVGHFRNSATVTESRLICFSLSLLPQNLTLQNLPIFPDLDIVFSWLKINSTAVPNDVNCELLLRVWRLLLKNSVDQISKSLFTHKSSKWLNFTSLHSFGSNYTQYRVRESSLPLWLCWIFQTFCTLSQLALSFMQCFI